PALPGAARGTDELPAREPLGGLGSGDVLEREGAPSEDGRRRARADERGAAATRARRQAPRRAALRAGHAPGRERARAGGDAGVVAEGGLSPDGPRLPGD